MSDDVQRQITWLLCFDDGEADHIGAARCAETMKSQQAQIEQLEEKLHSIALWCKAYPRTVFIEPTKEQWADADKVLNDAGGCSLTAISGSNMRHVVEGISAIADCDNKPAPTKKPGKAHPWRKTQAPQR